MRTFIILCILIVIISACNEEEAIGPIACFEVSKESYFVGEQVSFTNCSNNAETYLWEINGITSEKENFSHSFTKVGIYNVKLTAFREDRMAVYEESITIVDDGTGNVINTIPIDLNSDIIDWDYNLNNDLYLVKRDTQNRLNLTKIDSDGNIVFNSPTFYIPDDIILNYISFGDMLLTSDKCFIYYNINHEYMTESGRMQDGWRSYILVFDHDGEITKEYRFENIENIFMDHFIANSAVINNMFYFVGGKENLINSTWLLKLNSTGDLIEDKLLNQLNGSAFEIGQTGNGDMLICTIEYRGALNVHRMNSDLNSVIWSNAIFYDELTTYYSLYYGKKRVELNEDSQEIYIFPTEPKSSILGFDFEGNEFSIPVSFNIQCQELIFHFQNNEFITGCIGDNIIRKFDKNGGLLIEKMFPSNFIVIDTKSDLESGNVLVLANELDEESGVVNFRIYNFD